MQFFMRETPQQEIEIEAILDCQLSSDRYEIKDKFAESFKTMENNKKAEKMWEPGNFNT